MFWLRVFEPFRRHHEFCRTTRAELETLAKKRPTGISRKQWHHIVNWTLNAHSNTLVATRQMPREEMDRFETELKQRLQGPVDLGTIDWIWDEFVRLAPGWGPSYSERWRPTSPEKLREFEESSDTIIGVEVD